MTDSQSSDSPYPAPQFIAKEFHTQKEIKLSDFKGKLVLVHFWFAGCPPCRVEAPAFKSFAESHPEITILTITSPELNEPGAVEDFTKKFEWNFPVLLDENIWIGKRFDKDIAYPTTFLINKDGKVVGKIVNYFEWEGEEAKDLFQHFQSGKLIWYSRNLRRLK